MRIGIDLGGTKIEGVLMAADGRILRQLRHPTPRDQYGEQVNAIVSMVCELERAENLNHTPVGIGHPGAISPHSGLIKNANSLCLNGQCLQQDIERALGRPVRMANDADCLAVSEQADGAAAGAKNMFAVILGTGVGGAAVVHGRLLQGPNAIAGEWGHNPLPWPRADWGEVPGPLHWDGRHGAIEAWLAGPGLARDHLARTGESRSGEDIVQAAEAGNSACGESLNRYEHRLARSLATVINLLDPEVIVLGGGISRVSRLYANVPRLWQDWVFSDTVRTRLEPAAHGDASGVRGAAWLWPAPAG